MPIVTIQRQFRELGRIRLGEKGPRGEPKRLATWRLTSPDRSLLEAAAEQYGGDVAAWPDAPDGDEHQLITGVDELDILVPPGAPLTQWNELWSGAGCQRRCDGQREWLQDVPCICPPDPAERNELAKSGGACKPTSRLQVILPKLPDLGTWMYVSHGYYAAVELAGTADLLAAAASAGTMLEASLYIDQRTVKRPGQQTRKFPVPAIRIRATMTRLLEGGGAAVPQLSGGRVPAQLTTSAPLPDDATFTPRPDDAPPCKHPPEKHETREDGVLCTECGVLLARREAPPRTAQPAAQGAGVGAAPAAQEPDAAPRSEPATSPPGGAAPATLDEATVRVGNVAVARGLVDSRSPDFWASFDAVMRTAGVEVPPLEQAPEVIAEWNALADRIELGEFQGIADDPAGRCSVHNEPWKWVPPGTNKAGKEYRGFFACPARDCSTRPSDAWRRAHKPPAVVTP